VAGKRHERQVSDMRGGGEGEGGEEREASGAPMSPLIAVTAMRSTSASLKARFFS
jgi:hypothetical protein